MSQNTTTQQARTVQTADHGAFDVKEAVLYAVLLAAGIILNFASKPILGNFSMISPEFVITSFCLMILISKPNLGKALVIGLIAGVIIQFTASVKGPDLVAETISAAVMALIVKAGMKTPAKAVVPAIGTFVTTFLSGCIYAVIVALLLKNQPEMFMAMMPVVALTGVFNGVLVQALFIPIKKALKIAE